jgi:hypothetical protein
MAADAPSRDQRERQHAEVLPGLLVADAVPWSTHDPATAKVPYMKTSEWAKLMSCRTPYTIV